MIKLNDLIFEAASDPVQYFGILMLVLVTAWFFIGRRR